MLHDSIPAAMYHHVAPTDRELNVFPEIFENQLGALHGNGWKTLSADEFVYFLLNGKERPKKCILLTFDDGFADNYIYAYPLLRKFKMKATIFVATDFIADADVSRDPFVPLSHNPAWELAHTGRRSEVMCTWKELEEMEDSGIIDIQSHGMSHRTWRYMKERNYTELGKDLSGSKSLLEKRLSKNINHLCWPGGYYDEDGIKAAEEAGYKALYTTERGFNTAENLKTVSRLPVKNKRGRWLLKNAAIYSSVLLTRLYLAIRTG